MDDKKKRHAPHRDGERKEQNGQRISVRPGNFTPPGAPTLPTAQPAQQNSGERRGHHGRNHHNRRPAGNNQQAPQEARRDAQNGGNQGNQPPVAQGNTQANEGGKGGHGRNRRNRNRRNRNRQENAAQAQNTPVTAQTPAPASAPQSREAEGNRSERRDNRRGGKGQRSNQPAADLITPSLRRELDEEFSTPAFSPFTTKKATVESAVDTDEFAVDIATAAYLVEDVPCGFPIPDGKAVEVVGVRFRSAGKMYFFAPNGMSFRIGQSVLVDTARGEEIGEIVMLKRRIAEKDIVQPLRCVLRLATEEDLAHEQENRRKEREALKTCAEKIAEHKLDMTLVDAQYTFDNTKLLFYFTSEGRVDFRDLVRDLAGIFRTRIELRQIGIRDESRLIGGLGMCGRPFCCSTFLSDFGQVSIKMAKEQGLSINASKISGCCGRLMCCLRYEHETYAAEARLTPKKDTPVETPDGRGVVVDATPLAGTVRVRLDNAAEEAPRTYHRDQVKVLSREKQAPADAPSAPAEQDGE